MFKRVMVAVVGIPVLIGVLSVAPVWAAMLLLAVLCALGARELLLAATGRGGRLLRPLAVAAAALLPFCVYTELEQRRLALTALPEIPLTALLALALVFLLFLLLILRYDREEGIPFADLTASVFAGLIFPLMLSCLLRLRMMEYGQLLVWTPLVIAFGSDTFALFAGMLFGKHKMAPRVSPHKTVEGGIGGLMGGVVGLLVLKLIARYALGVVFLSTGQLLLLGLLGAAVGEIGDLSFSVIKREYGVKDYGRLLPGHGGVLDRFDSVTFVAPLCWLVFSLLG